MEENNFDSNEPQQTEAKRGKSKAAVVVIVIVVCGFIAVGLGIAVGTAAGLVKNKSATEETGEYVYQSSQAQQKLQIIQDYIDDASIYDLEDEKAVDDMCRGLVASLDDPYAAYYNAEEYTALMETTGGSYCGIGATLSQSIDTGLISVVGTFDDSPAKEAGMKQGDILYKVDGEDISTQDLNIVVTKLKGEENTNVTVTVVRDRKEVELEITRKKIEIPTIEYDNLGDDVGYIKIVEFDEITSSQFNEALDALQKEGIKGLVIDLRNNPGGRVDTVCEIADAFLSEGVIVSTKDKQGNEQKIEADEISTNVPVSVLINGDSASASEIFAGALQDYDRATIIGTQSYGKGIVQSVIPLGDGTALKITTAYYYTPNGTCIHEIGITPDIVMEMPEEEKENSELTLEEDSQVQKAKKEVLQ